MGAAVSRPLIGVTTSEMRLASHTSPLPEGDPRRPRWRSGSCTHGRSSGPALYLGVQWHVETLIDRPRHALLFDALVAAATARAAVGEQRAA